MKKVEDFPKPAFTPRQRVGQSFDRLRAIVLNVVELTADGNSGKSAPACDLVKGAINTAQSEIDNYIV